MTKKDYIKIADCIVATNKDISDGYLDTPAAVLLNIWSRLADMAYNDNGNFSYTKFTDYINSRVSEAV